MKNRPFFLHLFLTFIVCVSICNSCTNKLQQTRDLPENKKENIDKPYVILISLDGYRWDYTARFQPPNIQNFIAEGFHAESIIPCFPSKTFPNHYSIATGMYPDNHGLVDNSFYSPEKKEVYKIRDREKVQNGSWYGGTPIWVQAAKNGFITASYFFVGSEADVMGIRPTYYYDYEGSVPNEKRISQALDWLNMPEENRPHLITLYFSDMDDAGHRHGPNNDEKLREKLMQLDAELGVLFNGIKKTGLDVNIIIVSDHGMLEVPVNQMMPIEQIENEEKYKTINNGAIAHIYLNDKNELESVLTELKNKANNYKVYKTVETPGFEYSPENPNWGDIQIVPDQGWYFSWQRSISMIKSAGTDVKGEHGFSPGLKEMHGILYGNGPAFKEDFVVPSVKNIHVYPLICKVLGLEIPANIDGDFEKLKMVLK